VLRVAEKRFRRLDAPQLLRAVFSGARFKDGVLEENAGKAEAA
jgi:hypothetical protein